MIKLNSSDKHQLRERGITENKLYEQIDLIKRGVPCISLLKPCTVGDGIRVFSPDKLDEYVNLYNISLGKFHPVKFVPSSGAASRMFGLLNKIKLEYQTFEDRINAGTANEDDKAFMEFISNIDKFAFHDDLKDVISRDGSSLDKLLSEKNYGLIIEYVLSEKGLNYSNCPKGLIKFHKYDRGPRVAFEEHLVEAINYSTAGDSVSRLHFTVLKEHEESISEYIDSVIGNYETSGIKFDIGYSFQSPQTDIIALDFDDIPLRDEKGMLIFRPGGHGALLQNLNALDHNLIFIKNIDNVVPDHLKEQTYTYKKALAGLLIELKTVCDDYLKWIKEDRITRSVLNDAIHFASINLGLPEANGIQAAEFERQKEYLFEFLNRPLRICGVVKNENEPGGGPFWITDSEGKVSMQIVESAQVDMNDPDQKRIWESSTHFNPVDLVCSIHDFEGNKFDLQKFIDLNTVFITKKSKDGVDIKSMELPGLWNGSMAFWNTVFIEVPRITFNPVKTVMDLLREEHLPVS